MSSPPAQRKTLLLKTFWRRFRSESNTQANK